MTTSPDIFLSYSREDQVRAKLFASAFEAQGFSVWWDVGLRTGEAYDEVTENALRSAKAVVVLWSKTSVASRWVRAEATLADRNKTLVPVMIEACERPIMFELTQTAELMHWQGDAGDNAWRAFLGDVKRFVSRPIVPAASEPAVPSEPPTVQETLKPGQSGSAPSLAILPFTNRSTNPDDEVFAEGMVEDVISALSQSVNVRVLGSTATANLSRSAITDVSAIGRQLGVRYLLEGNVRRTGQSLRVTTQLLEAATGEIVWTGRFDRPLAELASLQEDLVMEVAASLDTQVYNLEMARAVLKKPADITAWEAVARVLSAFRRFDPGVLQFARQEAERAVVLAPDFAGAHATLAIVCANEYLLMPDDEAEVRRIRAIVARALELEPDNALCLAYAGLSLSHIGFSAEGLRFIERALQLAPGLGYAHFFLGICLVKLNRFEAALPVFHTAFRLLAGSHMRGFVKEWEATGLAALGRWDEAKAAIDLALLLNPSLGLTHVLKARICIKLGLEAEARQHIETAYRYGWRAVAAAQVWRRLWPGNPEIEADTAVLGQLFAPLEAGR